GQHHKEAPNESRGLTPMSDSASHIPANPARMSRESFLDQFTHPGDGMNDAILQTALIRNLREATLTVQMGRTHYGHPKPEIIVHVPRGTPHRKASAALHAIAALVELATPVKEGWVVVVNHCGDESGSVELELFTASEDEARRGLAVLQRV